jgi:hypothetical protein
LPWKQHKLSKKKQGEKKLNFWEKLIFSENTQIVGQKKCIDW